MVRPVFVAALVLAVVLAVSTWASTSPKQWDRRQVNHFRTSHSVFTLDYAKSLQERAQRYAEHMAATGVLEDDNAGQYTCWNAGGSAYGSNVGSGPDVRDIQYAFQQSPGHRANTLDRTFYHLGLGIARGHGAVWVVQDFCGRSSSSTKTLALPTPIALGN